MRSGLARATEMARAAASIWAESSARRAGVRSLESAIPSMAWSAGRMTAAATRGPARAPRPASSAPATRPKPASRSRSSKSAVASTSVAYCAKGAIGAPLRDLVWWSGGIWAGRWSVVAVEPAGAAERPDADEGAAHDGGAVDRAEDAGVLGVVAVVAHDVELARRDGDGPAVGGGARGEVGLVDGGAVAVEPAAGAGEPVARDPDDPLDEVAVGRRGDADGLAQADEEAGDGVGLVHGDAAELVVDEDDDVAVLGLPEAVGDLLDEDAVGDVEGGLHGAGGDVEGLDEERLEDDGEQDGEDDEDDGLAEDREGARGLVLLGARAWDGGARGVLAVGVVAGAGDGSPHARAVRFSLIFAALPTRSRR